MKIIDIPQSGKIGNQVAMPGRYGQVRRIWVAPANPRSPDQLTIRGNLAASARGFDALTPAQQTAWRSAAATVTSKPRLGQSGPLTGLQLFTKINCTLAMLGQDPVTDPPAPANVPAPAPDALQVSNVSGVVSIKLTCPTSPGAGTLVRAAAPQKSGVNRLPSLRLLGTCPAPVTGASDITGLFTAKFGAPIEGQRLFVEVQSTANGWQGPTKVFSALVPAAS